MEGVCGPTRTLLPPAEGGRRPDKGALLTRAASSVGDGEELLNEVKRRGSPHPQPLSRKGRGEKYRGRVNCTILI